MIFRFARSNYQTILSSHCGNASEHDLYLGDRYRFVKRGSIHVHNMSAKETDDVIVINQKGIMASDGLIQDQHLVEIQSYLADWCGYSEEEIRRTFLVREHT